MCKGSLKAKHCSQSMQALTACAATNKTGYPTNNDPSTYKTLRLCASALKTKFDKSYRIN